MLSTEDIVYFINQIHEIEVKSKNRSIDFLDRNIFRLKNKFEELGYIIVNPIGEKLDETRTDLEVHISSEKTNVLTIKEVIKPIIFYKNINGTVELIQKGNAIA